MPEPISGVNLKHVSEVAYMKGKQPETSFAQGVNHKVILLCEVSTNLGSFSL
jgi:hypothetical protein